MEVDRSIARINSSLGAERIGSGNKQLNIVEGVECLLAISLEKMLPLIARFRAARLENGKL